MALGTFFSHGLAIIFGSSLGLLENDIMLFYLKAFTYVAFLCFGIFGFLPKKDKAETNSKTDFIKKLTHHSFNYIFIVAVSIMVGELGDKTFLASIGLGLQYPNYKIALIAGSIMGMIFSNFIAILFGRFLNKKVPSKYIEVISNSIFIVFGLIGLIMLFSH